MLDDTFKALLPGGVRIASPLIWEMSRFTVQSHGGRRNDLLRVARTTGELILAVNNLGTAIGLSHFVTVYAASMHRMFALSGIAGDPIGPPAMIGDVLTYAVTYELGDELTTRLRRIAGDVDVNVDGKVVRELAIAA
jgi:acyl homoserine lactone synthase